jgi:membrane fusion protein, copper/silver efflux system
MRRQIVVSILAVIAAFVAGIGYGRWYGPKSAPAASAGARNILYYVDPMHPSYKSDKPGIAPDCGMKLEPVYADGGAAATPPPNAKPAFYRDPQQPTYTSDKAGINPETGNDLEPVYEGTAAAMPPGTIRVSPEKQQMVGVRYGTVERGTASVTLRASGRVVQDETRVVRVHSKIEGWIERVFLDFTGQPIQKGQPLLTLYSPEMLATEQEYLLAVRNLEAMKKSSLDGAQRSAEALVEAARRRLELWDVPAALLEEVRRTGKPVRTTTLYAPASGVVITRNAFPGQRIMPETELYVIGDLSRVWIMADVFESDMPAIRNGLGATVAIPGEGRSFTARVTNIVPQVDAATRTLKVRLEAANPSTRLKPDMFVDVTFATAGRVRLSVPVDAVLDAGLRKTVFVDRGNGYIEPRAVATGERFGDRIEIVSGLKAGERIVTSGTFLIDSESQLKAGMAGMSTPPSEPPPPAPQPAEHHHD